MNPKQIEIEGMTLVAPVPDSTNVHLRHCNQDAFVGVCKYGDKDCPALARRCDFCYQEALYFVQYPCGMFAHCPVCYERRQHDFKARVAALLGSLLGGPPAAGGIVNAVRAMHDELKEEGY